MSTSIPCVIVGAGGHARVVAGILERLGERQLVGVLDRTSETTGEKIGFSEVIGSYGLLPRLSGDGVTRVYLGIGDNNERQSLSERYQDKRFVFPTLIHPAAILEPGSVLGYGTVICAGAIIGAGAQVGSGCIINSGAIVDHETKIGNFTHIAPGAYIAGRCNIGANCLIGIGSVVKDFIHVGSGSIVGAGAAVINNLPNDSVAIGVPAKMR